MLYNKGGGSSCKKKHKADNTPADESHSSNAALSNSNLPLNFHNIELTQEDREVIRKCKRDAFRATTRKPDNNVTPISLENLVHRKKISLIKGSIKKPRKLGMIDEIQKRKPVKK